MKVDPEFNSGLKLGKKNLRSRRFVIGVGTVAVENCRDGARPVVFGRPCKMLIISNTVFVIEHGRGD
ncbi:MAG: hypothetical protein FWF09_08275 [Bacteroidales bacterium]|nr:hypothetical protein [Bacteroidales bacterium]